jgi:acetolactate synthase-1/2/3 large subunit
LAKNINKVVNATVAVEGDVVENLKLLLPFIKPVPRKSWFEQLDEWKQKYPFSFVPSKKGGVLKPQEVIVELNEQCKDIKHKVIITTGVGQHQMWACQYFRWRHPRSWVSSGGLGIIKLIRNNGLWTSIRHWCKSGSSRQNSN